MKYFKYVNWNEISEKVKDINPQLHDIIMAINPNKDLRLILAEYSYGQHIIKQGKIKLPDNNTVIDLKDTTPSVQTDLSYSAIPLALPLTKSSEAFIASNNNHVIPLKYFDPGDLFGSFEVINSLVGITIAPIWSVTAGARTLIMLPKISDKNNHQRLNDYFNIETLPPRNLQQQWSVFKDITASRVFNRAWTSEVLFFTKDWFTKYKKTANMAWSKFYHYLFESSWLQAQHTQTDVPFNLLWQAALITLGDRNLKPRPYLVDTIKHLLAAPSGAVPAFRFTTNENVAPINALTRAYENVYGLKKHFISFMHSYNLLPNKEKVPLYYSLSYPIIVEGYPDTKNLPSNNSDMQQIKLIINLLQKSLPNHLFGTSVPFESSLNIAKYHYYHVNSTSSTYHAKEIINHDHILQAQVKDNETKSFCYTSSFFKGCISINLL